MPFVSYSKWSRANTRGHIRDTTPNYYGAGRTHGPPHRAGPHPAAEEAALDVGASRLRVFVQITLPLVLPALSAAILLTFVGTFYEAQGALLIGLPTVRTMPILMYTYINNQVIVQYGAVISLVLWLPSLVLLSFAQRFLRGEPSVLDAQGPRLERPIDHHAKFLDVERLGHVIVRAALDRLHGHSLRAVRGEQDHR